MAPLLLASDRSRASACPHGEREKSRRAEAGAPLKLPIRGATRRRPGAEAWRGERRRAGGETRRAALDDCPSWARTRTLLIRPNRARRTWCVVVSVHRRAAA